jgi:hypothetical protein
VLYLAFLYLDVDCDGQLSADDLSVHLPGVAEIEFGVCVMLGYIGYLTRGPTTCIQYVIRQETRPTTLDSFPAADAAFSPVIIL